MCFYVTGLRKVDAEKGVILQVAFGTCDLKVTSDSGNFHCLLDTVDCSSLILVLNFTVSRIHALQ